MEEILIQEVKQSSRRVQPQQEDEHEWLPPEALRTEKEEVAAADAEAAWRDMEEEQQEKESHPKIMQPRYTPRLAALVLEYTNRVEQGAWASARTCLDQALPPPCSSSSSSSSSSDDDVIYALQDMGTALLSSIKKRPGWGITIVNNESNFQHLVIKGHGGASAAPSMLKSEILSPLRTTVRDALTRRRRRTSSAPLELEGEGGALILALAMEGRRLNGSQQQQQEQHQQNQQQRQEEVDGDEDEQSGNYNENFTHTALALITYSPSLLSLHCCALALAHHMPLPSASSSSSSSPLALDCVIAALSMLEPTWHVSTTLTELTTGPSFGGGLQGWKSKPELFLPPALTVEGRGVILPLRGEGDGAGLIEVARRMWMRFRKACHGQEKRQAGERTKKEEETTKSKQKITLLSPSSPPPPPPPSSSSSSSSSSPLVIQLLARIRLAWSTARAAHKEKEAARRLGRAALALVRSGLQVGEVNGEVLGHLLPLCFALMEQYEREEAQILGYVIWCFAADKTTGTELAWFLPIQMQVFQRGLKVLVKQPSVLRLLLFCTTELLRLTLTEQQEQLQAGQREGGVEGETGWRDGVLEDLLAALARASPISCRNDQSIVFALLEGMYRLLPLYKDGSLLVRYLRALTQVLTFAPFEEGDHAVRVVALRSLLLVLGQCHVVIHQHALETLAQVLRMYILLFRRGNKQTEEDKVIMALCRDVAGVLREGCKGQARQGLEAFVQGLSEEGGYDSELSGIWPSQSGSGIVEKLS